ncbi:MAG: hypothetical protein RI883_870 [Bacteroidota bacterium]|jgi:hypothetical protein
MKLDNIFLKDNSRFSNYLTSWVNELNIEVLEFSSKNEDSEEGIDGLVIFTENQEVDKEILDIRSIFDKNQKPVHKIDINGTLMVGVSNLELWIERNGCKKVLFLGSDVMLENPNLERYLANLK